MAVDWSDSILMANLTDEPALSDELSIIIEGLENKAQRPHAVLDLSEVSYINSSNIAQLIRLRKVLEDGGREMRISGVQDEVMSVLMVTGLDKVFRFAPDTLTAIAGLQLIDSD